MKPRALFPCPECGEETDVTDSRGTGEASAPIRRRRKCPKCDHRFSTVEVADAPDRSEAIRTVRLAANALRKALDALGDIPPPRTPKSNGAIIWTPEMEAALIEARKRGRTYLDCADIIGVGDKVIAKKCHALGLNGKANHGRTTAAQIAKEVA